MALIKSTKTSTSNIVAVSFQTHASRPSENTSKTENLVRPFSVIQREKNSSQTDDNSFWNYFANKDKKPEPEFAVPKIEMIPKEEAIQKEKEAYERGKLEAKTAAETEYLPQIQSMSEKIEEAHLQSSEQLLHFTEQIKDLAAHLVHAFQIQSMELGFALAEAMVQKEITTSPDSLAGVIEGVCEQFEESKKITILLHPLDIAGISTHSKMAALKKNQLIKIMPSEQVDRGGFILDGGLEGIDATIRVRLSKLREIIEKEVAAFLGTGISKLQAFDLIEKQVLRSNTNDEPSHEQPSHEMIISHNKTESDSNVSAISKIPSNIFTTPAISMSSGPLKINIQEKQDQQINHDFELKSASDAILNDNIQNTVAENPAVKKNTSAEKLISQAVFDLQHLDKPIDALVKNDQVVPRDLLDEHDHSKLPSTVEPEPKSKFPQANEEYQAKIVADMDEAKEKAKREVEEKLRLFREGKIPLKNNTDQKPEEPKTQTTKTSNSEEQDLIEEQNRIQQELAQMFDHDETEESGEEADESPALSTSETEQNKAELERELLEEQERMRKEIEEMMQSVDADENEE